MTAPPAPRRGAFVALLVLATLAVALVLLTVWQSVAHGSLAAGFPVAARTLFFFGDIALYLWVPFLVIASLRLGRRPRALPAFVVALAGGILNVVAVAAIGFVQEGRVASFVAIAVEGSLAVVVAAAIVIPIAYAACRWGAVPPARQAPEPETPPNLT